MTPLHRTYRLLSALLSLSLLAGALPLAWQPVCAGADGRPMRCCCHGRAATARPDAPPAAERPHERPAQPVLSSPGGCQMQAAFALDRQAAPAPPPGPDGPSLAAGPPLHRPAPPAPVAALSPLRHRLDPAHVLSRDRTVLFSAFLI